MTECHIRLIRQAGRYKASHIYHVRRLIWLHLFRNRIGILLIAEAFNTPEEDICHGITVATATSATDPRDAATLATLPPRHP